MPRKSLVELPIPVNTREQAIKQIIGVEYDELYDKEGNPIQMPELDEWANEIVQVVVASETGHPYEKDWSEYNRRGIDIAHRLRERLSPDFDLWYEAPFEDKSNTIMRRRLIY